VRSSAFASICRQGVGKHLSDRPDCSVPSTPSGKHVPEAVMRFGFPRQPYPRVKAQCIGSYGFLEESLHLVGSHIQMRLLIGRSPRCQLYSTIYRNGASLSRQIATWPQTPALKGRHGTVANKSLSVVARILNRARRVLRHRNRGRFTVYRSAMRQTRYISALAQPFPLLFSSLCRAMLHLARRVHNVPKRYQQKR